ncbi:hypothetical protein QTO34_019557 [Cnephaeus nilssonii]|uniref:Uncharacterized protein n=1 Tax=Cnephaeus nilssonii TaxID=3371016 RepID=A0AA40HWX3_CNENI|nr:hypothetical protein QTO34_019557 [Eptesicus nilssonii]
MKADNRDEPDENGAAGPAKTKKKLPQNKRKHRTREAQFTNRRDNQSGGSTIAPKREAQATNRLAEQLEPVTLRSANSGPHAFRRSFLVDHAAIATTEAMAQSSSSKEPHKSGRTPAGPGGFPAAMEMKPPCPAVALSLLPPCAM